jgi:L-cysteine desulfidase
MATYAEQSDYVLQSLADRASTAEQLLTITTGLIDQARSGITDMIAAYAALGVTVSVSGVDTTYVAPTAAAPTLPTADGVAIGTTRWDQIFARAAAKELRASLAEEQAANSEASLRGMAIPGVISNGMLSKQQQRAMDRVSLLAETSAVEEAKAAREDIMAVAKLGLEDFVAKWQTKVQSEEVRLKYEMLELDKNLKPEALRAEYDLKITELAQANAVAQLVELITVYAQLTAANYSASDTSLSAGTSFGVSGPFKWNPSAGEQAWFPTVVTEGGGGIQ